MGLPSYVVNFDELSDLIKDYLENGVNIDIGNLIFDTKTLEDMLDSIKEKIQGVDYDDLIAALNNLGIKLDALAGNLGISGTQKIYGKMLEIPASGGEHKIVFDVKRNCQLTGITYSLSAWNFQDNWDLKINNELIFEKVTTKEYGEHKYFNVFYPLKAGNKIEIIFNNNSNSSKILWVDFCMLENQIISDSGSQDAPVENPITEYRLLSIGESEYSISGVKNLNGPVYDADNISTTFRKHKYTFTKNVVAKNKTKNEVINVIKSTFLGATENDINYLFWSGHGTIVNNEFGLITKDTVLLSSEITEVLEQIKGTKVIFIDTCHSGLVIGKSGKILKTKTTFNAFNKSVDLFQKDLNKEGYKVITACKGTETSGDLSPGYVGNENPSGAFTWALTQSIKENKADINTDNKITLNELYQSILTFYNEFNTVNPDIAIKQTAMVYPENDNTLIFEYKE